MWNLHNVYAYRDENVKRLGFRSWRAYLLSPLWKSLRARVLAGDPPRRCWRCQRHATQVHHRAYDLATLSGQSLDALTPVCGRCHKRGERIGTSQSAADRFLNANTMIYQHGNEVSRTSKRQMKRAAAVDARLAAVKVTPTRRRQAKCALSVNTSRAPRLVKAK